MVGCCLHSESQRSDGWRRRMNCMAVRWKFEVGARHSRGPADRKERGPSAPRNGQARCGDDDVAWQGPEDGCDGIDSDSRICPGLHTGSWNTLETGHVDGPSPLALVRCPSVRPLTSRVFASLTQSAPRSHSWTFRVCTGLGPGMLKLLVHLNQERIIWCRQSPIGLSDAGASSALGGRRG